MPELWIYNMIGAAVRTCPNTNYNKSVLVLIVRSPNCALCGCSSPQTLDASHCRQMVVKHVDVTGTQTCLYFI